MKHQYSELTKLALLAAVAVMIFLAGNLLNKNPSFNVSYSCEIVTANSNSCSYSCYIKPECGSGNATLRIFVTHTVWASIYDKTFNSSCGNAQYYEFSLPRRNYDYAFHVAAYSKSGLGLLNTTSLKC